MPHFTRNGLSILQPNTMLNTKSSYICAYFKTKVNFQSILHSNVNSINFHAYILSFKDNKNKHSIKII